VTRVRVTRVWVTRVWVRVRVRVRVTRVDERSHSGSQRLVTPLEVAHIQTCFGAMLQGSRLPLSRRLF